MDGRELMEVYTLTKYIAIASSGIGERITNDTTGVRIRSSFGEVYNIKP